MKKILFVGYVVQPDEANIASGSSVAGNKMQWNVVKNLSENENVEIICITIPPIASYPHDKQVLIKSREEQLFPEVVTHRIGFCNLPIIKQFSQIINVYRTAKKIVEEQHIDSLLCFNLFPQVGIPMRWLKAQFKKLDTVCLLADLPIDDNTKRNFISRCLRTMMEKSTWKSMNVCDKYIVLNKYVMEKYMPDKTYIVVDGGVSEEDIQKYSAPVNKNVEKNILFCGALTEYNGILNIIKAMEYLKDLDVYLDIYGGGYLEKEVQLAAKANENIRFYGRVSNQIVMQKQREAWLLVNPRVIDDPIAKVTFPSKTFEYLLSGTPILATKLNAYGQEYYEYIYFSEDDTPSALADAIRKILNVKEDKLINKAMNAKKFVMTEKSWKRQAEKIEGFL